MNKLKNLLTVALFVSCNCQAQDTFFPDNYAKKEIGTEDSAETPKPTIDPNAAPAPQFSSEETPGALAETSSEPGTKLSSIGIIVNATDEPHVNAALHEFFRIIDGHKNISTSFIVLVGDPEESMKAAGPALSEMKLNQEVVKEFAINALLSPITDEEDQKKRELEVMDQLGQIMAKDETLMKRFAAIGKLSLVREVPGEYKITHSPGWVLDTERGKIMVEGIMKLGVFINDKGELVESMLQDTKEEGMEKIENEGTPSSNPNTP